MAIAVIGMALRVPGANTPERFWQNVVAGEDCLARLSMDGLRAAGVPRNKLEDPRFISATPLLRVSGRAEPCSAGSVHRSPRASTRARLPLGEMFQLWMCFE